MSSTPDAKGSILADLLSNLPNIVLYQKEDGWDFISDNIKDMIGYTVQDLMSDEGFILNIIHDKDRDETLRTIGQFSAEPSRNILTMEYRLKKKSGEYIWLQDHIIKHRSPKNTRYTGVLVDITERKRSEQLLTSSESKYRTLVENLTEGVLLLKNEKIEYANRSAQELLGLDSQVTNFKLQKCVIDPFRRTYNDAYAKMLVNSLNERVELKLIRPTDGHILDVEIDGGIQEDGTVLLVMHDISSKKLLAREQLRAQVAEETNVQLQKEVADRKTAEQRLIQIQKYTNSIINSSLDMIVATDNNNNINEFNPAAESTFGYSREEVIGKDIGMLFSDGSEMDDVLITIRDQGSFAREIVNRKKDNSLFITYLSASVLKDDDGNIVGSMGVSRDITAIKKAEEELKLSEERHRAIYDQAYIGIARIAKIGRFLLVNERLCEMLGYSANELYKLTFYDLTLPVEVEESLKNWDSLLSGEVENFSREQTYIHKNGDRINTNVTVSLVRDTKGNPNYYVAVFEDITERKAQELELKESLVEKEVLLKEVHHRVKNNMQVISSIINLQSAYIKDPEALQMLKESQDRIKSMSLVHESLYQSKTLSSVNFTEYVTNISKNLYYSYVRPTGGIQLHFNTEDVSLNLDTSIPCGLIINELLSNAMKYAFIDKEEGAVTVGLKKTGDEIELSVSDDGVGIPQGFVIEESDSLGLQLVSTLVMQIRGKLEIRTEKGTTFTIRFKEH